LFYRRGGGAVIVASEPGDDDPGWAEVPDGSVLTATPQQVSVTGLADASPAGETSGNGRIKIP
jgi:glutamine amidotransferase